MCAQTPSALTALTAPTALRASSTPTALSASPTLCRHHHHPHCPHRSPPSLLCHCPHLAALGSGFQVFKKYSEASNVCPNPLRPHRLRDTPLLDGQLGGAIAAWSNTAPRAWLCLQMQGLAHGQLSLGHPATGILRYSLSTLNPMEPCPKITC